MGVPGSLRKEAWPCLGSPSLGGKRQPCLRVPSLSGRHSSSPRSLCSSSALRGVGISCIPSRLSLETASMLSLLILSSPRLRVLVRVLPGPLTNLSSSPSGQDCENYITLLERQGEGLLACGTNARHPSCWSLVRRPLPICLVSLPLHGWASASQGGKKVGDSEAGSPCIECLGGGEAGTHGKQ